MSDPTTSGSDALRKIASRVGAMVRKYPPLAKRLRQSWTDYIALHVGHMEERRRREALQRQFAIEIMKKGVLEEQPRSDYEPQWDWELFNVRVPRNLILARDAEKDAAKRAPIIAKLAAATLKFIAWDDQIKACPDKVAGRAMWDRMDVAMPLGEYSIETIVVGFRPRPEFEMDPHPLTCTWEQFKRMPISVRRTVALVRLAVLHDAISATPILEPLASTIPEDAEAGRSVIVSWAVYDCLDPTSSRQSGQGPPTPDPRELPVGQAEAFLVLLEAECQRLQKKARQRRRAAIGVAVPVRAPESVVLVGAEVVPDAVEAGNDGPPQVDEEGRPIAFIDPSNPPPAPTDLMGCLRVLVYALNPENQSLCRVIVDVTRSRQAQGAANLRMINSGQKQLAEMKWKSAERLFGPQRERQLAGLANPPLSKDAAARLRPPFDAALAAIDQLLICIERGDASVLKDVSAGKMTEVTFGALLADARRGLVRFLARVESPMELGADLSGRLGGVSEQLQWVMDVLEIAERCTRGKAEGEQPAASVITPTDSAAAAAVSRHRSASWISEVTCQDLPPGTLRQMARRCTLKNQIERGGDVLYDVMEIVTVKPEFGAVLTGALAEGYVAKGRAKSRVKKVP